MTSNVSLATGVAAIVRPALLTVEGAMITERDGRLDAPIAEAERRMRDLAAPSDVISAVRAMYRRVGLDPTRRRPSSEALLRRVRRGEGLPRINTAVDVGNWCSLETQLPFGLYDLARLSGRLEVRLGRDGEEYVGIDTDVVHVAGRLTIADDGGPFGNPSADSARTKVTPATSRLLVVIYAPAALPAEVALRARELTAARLREYTGGLVSA